MKLTDIGLILGFIFLPLNSIAGFSMGWFAGLGWLFSFVLYICGYFLIKELENKK